MTEQKMNVSADHTEPAFFADSLSVSHSQSKFVFDFTQTTPRFDQSGEERHQSLTIKHKTLLLDPVFAKDVFRVLKDNLENYEKQFGQIKVPKQPKIKSIKKTEEAATTAEYTNYIG